LGDSRSFGAIWARVTLVKSTYMYQSLALFLLTSSVNVSKKASQIGPWIARVPGSSVDGVEFASYWQNFDKYVIAI